MKKIFTLAMRMKKKSPPSGGEGRGLEKTKHPCLQGKFFEVFRKKNHLREGDEKKSIPVKRRKKFTLTKLPTPPPGNLMVRP